VIHVLRGRNLRRRFFEAKDWLERLNRDLEDLQSPVAIGWVSLNPNKPGE
jgi:hypothetical protein